MKNEEANFPRFLSNDPIGEDHFTGGAQERISCVISEQIKNKSFSLIGIDGTWGSGKSNVIRLVEKKISATHHFFLYDAWSHHEDLQRRTFLEELTTDLIHSNMIDNKHWNSELKKLLSKTISANVKEVPKVSFVVIITLLTLFLLPVSNAINNSLPESRTYEKIWISLAPFLIAVISYAFFCMIRAKIDLSDIVAFYKEKSTEQVRSESILEEEPSVSSFRNWMEKLSISLNNKRVVIVFDNLDRLPDYKVKQIWSHIHTFFAEKFYANITVVVPFDRAHIGETFRISKEQNTNYTEETGEYYISKTFQVIFSIPPATLTDWRKFFISKFIYAFGELKDQAEQCATIYDLYNKPLTPREIISFINNLVALKLIWKDYFKEKYLALYCVTKQDYFNKNARAVILEGKYAENASSIFQGDERLPGIMASLYYNLPEHKAAEVLLFKEIEISIREKNHTRLLELKDQSDFYIVLEDVLNKINVPLNNLVTTLHEMEAKIEQKENDYRLETIWSLIIGKKISYKEPHEKKISDSDEILLNKAEILGRLPHLCRHLYSNISADTNFHGGIYGNQLQRLEHLIEKFKLSIKLDDILYNKELDPDDYLEFVTATKDEFHKYRVSANQIKLESKLLGFIPAQISSIYAGSYLSIFSFPNLVAKIEQEIYENLTLDNIDTIYQIYIRIKKGKLKTPNEKSLKILLKDSLETPQHYQLVAMRYSLGTKISTEGIDATVLRYSDPGFIEKISAHVLQYTSIDTLLTEMLLLKKTGICLVVKKIIENKQCEDSEIDYRLILPFYYEIITTAEVSEQDFFTYIDNWSSLIDTQISIGNFRDLFSKTNILDTFESHNTKVINKLRDIGILYIDSIIQSNRIATLLYDSDAFEIKLIKVLENKDLLTQETVSQLNNIILSFLVTLIKAKDAPLFYNDVIANTLSSILQKNKNLEFQSVIHDCLIELSEEEALSYDKFLFFEPLLTHLTLSGNSCNLLINKLLIKFIENKLSQLNILLYKEFYYRCFDILKTNALEFYNKLRKLRSSNPEDYTVRQLINEIGKVIFSNIQIDDAEYISTEDDQKLVNVTQEVKQLLESGEIFHFNLQNRIAGADTDPHFGVTKELMIKYIWNNTPMEGRWKEGDWVFFPK